MVWSKRVIAVLFLLFCFSSFCIRESKAIDYPEADSGFQRPMDNNHDGYIFLQRARYGDTWVWHPGWDYNGPGSGNADAGLPISSVGNGLVVSAPSSNPTRWGSIVIKHIYKGETVYSQYGHMQKVYVQEGNVVSKDQVIGELGGVPNFSAHLHWEIRKANHPDPTNVDYFNKKSLADKNNVSNWYYDPQWWVDNHGPYESPKEKPINNEEQIKNVSKGFAEAWYNYESQRSKNFFVRIKPFMTDYYYQATYDCHMRRPRDFIGQVPLQSHLISMEIVSISQDIAQTIATLYCFEPTTSRNYQLRTKLTLTKQNDKWLISYSETIIK